MVDPPIAGLHAPRSPGLADRRGPEAFGHGGAGGSIGFADPQHRIGFGYAMSKMWSWPVHVRSDPARAAP